ncbi:hypothetical protein VTN02DRAFT_1361 [Thermoascus thermophilus]
MELLSLALVLAPSPDPLPEILGAWRRCDEELTVLRAQEAEEAEQWDAKGDRLSLTTTTTTTTTTTSPTTIPGDFGPTDNELDALENEQQRAKRARARASRHHHHRAPSYTEDAPMGLFDVARGAARAFSKTAFPLRGAAAAAAAAASAAAAGAGQHPSKPSTGRASADGAGGQQPAEGGGGGRVRKRDVVSDMVTGGLVSGIGWVLGAQPVNRS